MISAPQAAPTVYGFTVPEFNSGLTFSIYSGNATPQISTSIRQQITLRAAINEVLQVKSMAGQTQHSIHVLKSVLNQFAKGREDVPLSCISIKDIESWLASKKNKPATKKSCVSRLSSLFSYHIRKDRIAVNPCHRLERIKVEHRAPLILTPEQTDTLLKHTPREFRPYVVLGLFAGIRPEETQRLTWKDICLETKTVTVNLAKTRRRRIVPIEPRAVALLEKCKSKRKNIAPSKSTVSRFKRETCKVLGFKSWPQDLLRHTAASYLIALLGDVGKVAARLGNSSNILLTHYHQPVKQSDCEKFWAVKPCPRPPRWNPKPDRKYDYKAVRAFYDACRSYKKTREHFGITNSATLHYILKSQKPLTA